MNKNHLLIIIFSIVIFGAGGFFAGMKYQESKNTRFLTFQGRGNIQQGMGQRLGQNFRPVNGEIISMDEKSITVKLQDGSSKIVLISEKTEINKADQAKKEDLKTGEKVAIFGQENTDGTVTAQNIQLNPIFREIPKTTP